MVQSMNGAAGHIEGGFEAVDSIARTAIDELARALQRTTD